MQRFLSAFLALLLSTTAHAQLAGPGGPASPPVVGNSTVWYTAIPAGGTVAAGAAQTQNTMSCLPTWVPFAEHWDRVNTNISGAGSSNLQFAIYAGGLDAAKGRIQPQGTALASSGDNVDTGTGVVTWTISPAVAVGPGVVFICQNFNDSTVILNAVGGSGVSNLIGSLNAGFGLVNPIKGLTFAGTYGTWPNLTGATMAETGTLVIPIMGYRVSTVP